jgi:hypothetical protein
MGLLSGTLRLGVQKISGSVVWNTEVRCAEASIGWDASFRYLNDMASARGRLCLHCFRQSPRRDVIELYLKEF